MTITAHATRTPYLFDKDLASRVLYAEVRAFSAAVSIHGRTEEEVQTLTRRLSWLVDRDLKWTDVDQMISFADEYRTAVTAHARGTLLIELFWEINQALGTVPARWEDS